MEHTPGPWEINEKRDDCWEITCGSLREVSLAVCELAYTGGNAEANAKLIAAAPGLLVACEAADEAFAAILKALIVTTATWRYVTKARTELREAIAKARGE